LVQSKGAGQARQHEAVMQDKQMLTRDASAVDLSTRICREASVLSTVLDGETVLMSVEEGRYFALNAVGTDIWARLESPVRAEDLIAALVNDYSGDAADIARDVMDLLRTLVGRGLVVAEP
jgi:hypothetical protein